MQYTTFSNLYHYNCGCTYCKNEKRSGENHHNWKGGISTINNYLRGLLEEWRNEKFKQYNYKCVITGINSKKLEVHHLDKQFYEIRDEVFKELGIDYKKKRVEYDIATLNEIARLIKVKHDNVDGVPLLKEIHSLFHSLYGKKNNTKEQFEEFKQRHKNGEFDELFKEVN